MRLLRPDRRRWAICFVIAVSALLTSAPFATGTAVAGSLNAETFELDNGMSVVVLPQPSQLAVTHMLWYRVGAVDEPRGQSGIAHFLEHLMFKGTHAHPAGAFSAQVARGGGRENAFTSSDYTAYFQTVAKDQLPRMMELEADRMTGLVLDPASVASERQVILEERYQRVDNRPEGQMAEHLDAMQFVTHPYRNPIIGWEHEIRVIERDDLERFYRHWYAPNNAVLVVAGNVTTDEVRPLAERFYGALPRAETAPREPADEPPAIASRRLTVADPRVSEAVWTRSYLAPSYRFGDTRHAYPLQVLAQLLGGGPTSHLYRRCVLGDGVDEPLAVNAGADYDPLRRGPSQLMIRVTPKPGVGFERIEAAVDAIIASLRSGDVDVEELERAKRRLRADAVYARDSLFAGAMAVGQALAIGLSVDDVDGWPDAIAAVTAADVAAAARAVFEASGSVTALLSAPPESTAAR